MAFQHHFEGYQVCMADEYLYAQDTGSSIACRQNGMTTSRLMLPELKPAVEFAYAFDGWASHYVSGLGVAGCKLELADAAGVAAHAQQGATTSN